MAEEPGRPGPFPSEVMSRVPRLSGPPAGPQRHGAAARPRPAVPGRRSWQQPVRRVSGRVQGGTREGLRPDSDGGDRELRQKPRVQAYVSDHPRQAALLRPSGLHAVDACPECWCHDVVRSHGDASEALQNAK